MVKFTLYSHSQAGADANLQNSMGDTPLHKAASTGRKVKHKGSSCCHVIVLYHPSIILPAGEHPQTHKAKTGNPPWTCHQSITGNTERSRSHQGEFRDSNKPKYACFWTMAGNPHTQGKYTDSREWWNWRPSCREAAALTAEVKLMTTV